MNFFNVFLAIFAFVGVAFLLLNIGYIFRRRAFRGTCSSNNPMLADKFGTCSVCGKTAEEECKMPDKKSQELQSGRIGN